MSDFDLTELLKSGDHSAFSEIYNRYWGVLYIHCLKMLKDEAVAGDVVQDLFVALWTKSSAIVITSNLSGYLYVTARHKVLNEIRKRKNNHKFMDNLSLFVKTNDNHILEQINEKDLARAIESEIQYLPQKMRAIFEYSRKSYLSHREIANLLGISDKTVKKQVANAIKILRLKLNSTQIQLIFIIWLISK